MFGRAEKPVSLSNEDRWEKNLRDTWKFLNTWLVASLGILVICAAIPLVQEFDADGLAKGLSMLGHGALLSLAFGGIGGLVGFLFGIPRGMGQATRTSAKNGSSSTSDSSDTSSVQAASGDKSTNLEQISDWLTKIILGAGLTQLVRIPDLMKRLGEAFGKAFGDNSFLPIVIVIGSLVFGFSAGYLMTQLFLVKALLDAERAQTPVDTALKAATNFERAGQLRAATATLEAGLTSLRPETPKVAKRDLYERLTYNLLYEEPPSGFEKAILYADEYIDQEPTQPSPQVFTNLGAALGQKYRWDSQHQAPQQSLDETRGSALAAAQRAISLEPQMKSVLRTMWNPNDPTKVRSQEDDLEVFFDDPEFKKLLG